MKHPQNTHNSYHAHIYFDKSTEKIASQIYNRIKNEFKFEVGRFHKKPVGPHTKWMFQVPFQSSECDDFIMWLEENRIKNLSILIHPLSGDNLKDHSELADWLGEPFRAFLHSDLELF